jgi:YidC/Oxa1 family membrane protein insertase
MGNLRPVLLMGMVFLAYLLWVEWQKDYGPPPTTPATTTSTDPGATGVPSEPTSQADDLPVPGQLIESGSADANQAGLPTADAPEQAQRAQLIRVTTDVLAAEIDLVGGTVVSAKLLNYPVELKQPEVKVSLLNRQGNELFIAQSGLLSRQSAPNHTSLYESDNTNYTLADDAEEVVVPLTWRSEDGVNVTKTLVFKRGRYEVDVS